MKYTNKRKLIIEIGLSSEDDDALNITAFNVDSKPISVNDVEVLLNNLHFLLEDKYSTFSANEVIEVLENANKSFQEQCIKELKEITEHKLNVHNVEYIEADVNIVHSIEIKYNESNLVYNLGLNDFICLEVLYNILNMIYTHVKQ